MPKWERKSFFGGVSRERKQMSKKYCINLRKGERKSVEREAKRYGLDAQYADGKLILSGDDEALMRAHCLLLRFYGDSIVFN